MDSKFKRIFSRCLPVARAIQLFGTIPRRVTAVQDWAAKRQHAAALLVSPAHSIKPMIMLRSASLICGMQNRRLSLADIALACVSSGEAYQIRAEYTCEIHDRLPGFVS